MKFENKVVVLTGGVKGIGRCIKETFEKQGAHVCIIDVLDNDYFVGSIGNKEDLICFTNKVIKDYGHVDYIINNAKPIFKGIDSCSYEEFNEALQVGVSNFRKSHLQNLLSKVHIVPSINQIETNPQMVDEETIQYCKENKIGVEAWSPLGSGACLNNPKIQEIANKYQKSSAQIILRWLLQKGIVILPKSVHENRIKENIDLFNFVLENEDVELINQLNQHKRTGPDPDNFDF